MFYVNCPSPRVHCADSRYKRRGICVPGVHEHPVEYKTAFSVPHNPMPRRYGGGGRGGAVFLNYGNSLLPEHSSGTKCIRRFSIFFSFLLFNITGSKQGTKSYALAIAWTTLKSHNRVLIIIESPTNDSYKRKVVIRRVSSKCGRIIVKRKL